MQAKVDELTIHRSKEIEIPDDISNHDEKIQLSFLMNLLMKDKTMIARMRSDIDKLKIKRHESEYEENSENLLYALPPFLIFLSHVQNTFNIEMQHINTRNIKT